MTHVFKIFIADRKALVNFHKSNIARYVSERDTDNIVSDCMQQVWSQSELLNWLELNQIRFTTGMTALSGASLTIDVTIPDDAEAAFFKLRWSDQIIEGGQ